MFGEAASVKPWQNLQFRKKQNRREPRAGWVSGLGRSVGNSKGWRIPFSNVLRLRARSRKEARQLSSQVEMLLLGSPFTRFEEKGQSLVTRDIRFLFRNVGVSKVS